MAFNGAADGNNTYCDSGQDVFLNALPNCVADQQVVFDGAKFACKDSPDVPTCNADQVLTYTAQGFICVARGASVPTCDKNQFLTYNGSAFQCASSQQIPACDDGQTLIFQHGQMTCGNAAGSTFGAWQLKSFGPAFHADTDGIVIAHSTGTSVYGMTGADPSAMTGSPGPGGLHAAQGTATLGNVGINNLESTITMPVRKGDYWAVAHYSGGSYNPYSVQIDGTAANNDWVWWIPLGN
jgi:hypothetical protein